MSRQTGNRLAENGTFNYLSKWIMRAITIAFVLGFVAGTLTAHADDWRSPDDRLRSQAESERQYRDEQRLRDIENQQYLQDRRTRQQQYEIDDVRSSEWFYSTRELGTKK